MSTKHTPKTELGSTHNAERGLIGTCLSSHTHAKYTDQPTHMFMSSELVNQRELSAEHADNAEPETLGETGKELSLKQSPLMAESANVAGNQSHDFSRSTTPTATEAAIESKAPGAGGSTNGLPKKDTQEMGSGSCATTAIAPEDSTASARTKSSFTPGPWRVSDHCPSYVIADQDDGARHIAGCCHAARSPSTEDYATARLIAAAPELLDQLKHALRYWDQLTQADAERYRAVIEKAEGGAV